MQQFCSSALLENFHRLQKQSIQATELPNDYKLQILTYLLLYVNYLLLVFSREMKTMQNQHILRFSIDFIGQQY